MSSHGPVSYTLTETDEVTRLSGIRPATSPSVMAIALCELRPRVRLSSLVPRASWEEMEHFRGRKPEEICDEKLSSVSRCGETPTASHAQVSGRKLTSE